MATDVVVLFALEREARPFRKRCPGVPVYLTGVGVERAREVTRRVLEIEKPGFLILAGYGGALTATARVGDVIVVNEVCDEHDGLWSCFIPLPAFAGRGGGRVLNVRGIHPPPTPPCKAGEGDKRQDSEDEVSRVLTVNRMIATMAEKLELGRRHAAQVCDMESSAVAAICQEHDVPFLAVRAISDTAERSLPIELDAIIQNGQVSIWQAIRAIARRPSLLGEFRTLMRDTRIASRKLAEALSNILTPRAS